MNATESSLKSFPEIAGSPTKSKERPAHGNDEDRLAVYAGMVWKRGMLLLGISVIAGIAAYFATALQTPIFQAHSSLEVQTINENLLNIQNVSPVAPSTGAFSQEYEIQTAIRTFKSRSVIVNALSKLDLRQRLEAAQKPGVDSRLLNGLRYRSPKHVPLTEEQLLVLVYNGTKIQAQTNTRVLDLTVDSPDSTLSSDLANSLTDSYIELSMKKRWDSVQSVGTWLTSQMKDLKVSLERSEAEMQTYAQKSDLLFTSETDNVAEQRLKQMQEEMLRAQADRVAKQSRFEQANMAGSESLPEVLDSTTLKEYQVDLTRMKQQLAELNSSFTGVYPKTVKLRAQVASLEQARDRERETVVARLHNEFDVAHRRERLLRADFARQASQLSAQSAKVAQFNLLKHEVQTTRQMYELMGQRVREAGLASAMRASNVQVMDRATPPPLPHRPSRLVNTGFGVLSGFLFGMAGVIVSGNRRLSVYKPGQLVAELRLPELAVIPSDIPVSTRSLLPSRKSLSLISKNEAPQVELATFENRSPAIADSFRGAVIAIIGGRNGVCPQVIVISSAWPGEGKTTVACNLAIMLAQSNRRVLLIDGDLRRPRLHSIFQASDSLGLSDSLFTGAPPRIQPTCTPRLSLLTSGSLSNVDGLFTANLPILIRRLRADFDFILVDTPPLLQIPDARMIAQSSDAVILTVDAKVSSREDLYSAVALLQQDKIPLLGTILNNYRVDSTDRRYNYYTDMPRQSAEPARQ